MVCTCKYKSGSAGNGTEAADNQAVSVDRVVVEYVVFFEIDRVVHEIVVHRIGTDGNIGIFDDRV